MKLKTMREKLYYFFIFIYIEITLQISNKEPSIIRETVIINPNNFFSKSFPLNITHYSYTLVSELPTDMFFIKDDQFQNFINKKNYIPLESIFGGIQLNKNKCSYTDYNMNNMCIVSPRETIYHCGKFYK
jgi:hypothetical protein